MIAWRPRPVAMDDVATVVIGGWLAGSAVAGFGTAVVAGGMMLSNGEAGAVLLLPQILFGCLFAAGFVSIIWVLPIALLLVPFMLFIGLGPRTGVLVCFVVGCAYAIGFLNLSDWRSWNDFWFVPPVYGVALGLIYARTVDA